MMWYKNVRLILDSLALLQQEGVPFRALLVGDGYDAPDIQAYSVARGLRTAPFSPAPFMTGRHCAHITAWRTSFSFLNLRHLGHRGQGGRRLRLPHPARSGSCAAEGCSPC